MQNLVITNSGQELMSKLIAGTTTATFTKIAGSDYDYSDVSLEGITELEDVKQTALISKVSRTDLTLVEVLAALDNSSLTEGYYVKALGLYAKDGDGTEILYAISIEPSTPDYLPAFSGKTVSSITYRLITKVDNSEQVTLEVNPEAYPTVEQVEELSNSIPEISNSVSEISKSLQQVTEITTDLKSHAFKSTVNNLTTTTTGYALDATQGKVLNDKITDLTTVSTASTTNLSWTIMSIGSIRILTTAVPGGYSAYEEPLPITFAAIPLAVISSNSLITSTTNFSAQCPTKSSIKIDTNFGGTTKHAATVVVIGYV